MAGDLVAEYGGGVSTHGTQYVMGDQQGSPRVTMFSSPVNNQLVVARQDYLPFGEEVPSGVGSRAGVTGYGQPTDPRQKYAGMEQDEYTGMNHTLWREFDPMSARWTAPDPYGGSLDPSSPQSFNRYVYCNNDPVNKVDPTGLMLSDIGVYQTDNAAVATRLNRAMIQRTRDYNKAVRAQALGRQTATQRTNTAFVRGMQESTQSRYGGYFTRPINQPLPSGPSQQDMGNATNAAMQEAAVRADQSMQVARAIDTMRIVLSTNNACTQFFSPSGAMALEALAEVVELAPVFAQGQTSPSPYVGIQIGFANAVVIKGQSEIAQPGRMTVNTAGMFFNSNPGFFMGEPTAGASNSAEGQAIQFAHEVGHVARRNRASILAYDDPRLGAFGPVISRINTLRVSNACLSSIRAVLAQMGPRVVE